MATRIEKAFGAANGLGATYTLLFTGTTGLLHNVLLSVTNVTTGTINFRAYVATNGWSSGEPADGSTKVKTICYDMPIAAGETDHIAGFVVDGTQKVVVRAASTGLDVYADGVEITP